MAHSGSGLLIKDQIGRQLVSKVIVLTRPPAGILLGLSTQEEQKGKEVHFWQMTPARRANTWPVWHMLQRLQLQFAPEAKSSQVSLAFACQQMAGQQQR